MRVTIFGSGYVGLVTGACLADAGNHVMCVDVDAAKIERLNRGEVPIHEPGLEALIKLNAEAGRIEFTTDAARAVEHGLFQLIAVGTPPGEDGSADLRHVLAVARTIATHLNRYGIVITKSTVPVGTADKVRAELERTLAGRGVKVEFDVVSNPEFLKEGAAIADFTKPDRVVIGTDNGGSCFPKDVQALIRSAHEAGHEPQILNAVESVNGRQKEVLFRKMQRHFTAGLKGRTVALWGLAFKPNTDDMREAPSRTLIDLLLEAGARVQAYDPVAAAEARRIYAGQTGLVLAKNAYEAAQGADALAIVTEWQEFRSPDFQGLKQLLRAPLIFDGRNLYDPSMVSRFGLTYHAIGRGKPLVAA